MVVKDFCGLFYNMNKKVYSDLRGYDESAPFRERTEKEVEEDVHPRSLTLFDGNFIVPSWRYCQKRNAKQLKNESVWGFAISRVEAAAKHVTTLQEIHAGKMHITVSVNTDETDLGEGKIRYVRGRGIVGAIEFAECTDLINENGLDWIYARLKTHMKLKSSDVQLEISSVGENVDALLLEDTILPLDYKIVSPLNYILDELSQFDEKLEERIDCFENKLRKFRNKHESTYEGNRVWGTAINTKVLKRTSQLENVIMHARDLMNGRDKIVEQCRDFQSRIADADLHEAEEDEQNKWIALNLNELSTLFNDACDELIQLHLTKLEEASKVQLVTVVDCMKEQSFILGAFHIGAANSIDNRIIINEAIRLLQERNICVQNCSFDGGNRYNLFYGEKRTTFLSFKARESLKACTTLPEEEVQNRMPQWIKWFKLAKKSLRGIWINLIQISKLDGNWSRLFNHIIGATSTGEVTTLSCGWMFAQLTEEFHTIFDLNESIAWHWNKAKVFCDSMTVDVTSHYSALITGVPHDKRAMVNSFVTSIAFILSIYEKKTELSRMVNQVKVLEKANGLARPFNVKSLLMTVITSTSSSVSVYPNTKTMQWIIGLDKHLADLVHEKKTHGRDFVNRMYQPEYFSWSFDDQTFQVPRTYTIDSDHAKNGF